MNSNSKPRRPVLVTGGAGYIGAHACQALHQAGLTPVVYDDLSSGHRDFVKWGEFVEGSIADAAKLTETFKRFKPQAVLHFAASALVAESVSNPLKYYQNNVAGTVNLLQTLVEQECRNIVFSSTCAIYGNPTRIPITENESPKPIQAYGKSKWMVEKILNDAYSAYGINSVSLRYFNASGSDPEGQIGESHDPETHLIPTVLKIAKGHNGSVQIFGEDYETPDGTCVRDYVHVCDLADAHLKALQYLETKPGAHALNLGTGTGHSVKQILTAAEKVIGRKIPSVSAPRRPGDPPVLVADPALAKRVLGWEPKFPKIEDQIKHAWNWINR